MYLIIPSHIRVVGDSFTIIDHKITNDLSHFIESGVIHYNRKLSNHNVIFSNVLGQNCLNLELPLRLKVWSTKFSCYVNTIKQRSIGQVRSKEVAAEWGYNLVKNQVDTQL